MLYRIILQDENCKFYLKGSLNPGDTKIKYEFNYMGLIKEWEDEEDFQKLKQSMELFLK